MRGCFPHHPALSTPARGQLSVSPPCLRHWQRESRLSTRRLLGDISLSLPLLSFLGLAATDESSVRVHVHRQPSRRPGSDGEEEEEEEEEASAPESPQRDANSGSSNDATERAVQTEQDAGHVVDIEAPPSPAMSLLSVSSLGSPAVTPHAPTPARGTVSAVVPPSLAQQRAGISVRAWGGWLQSVIGRLATAIDRFERIAIGWMGHFVVAVLPKATGWRLLASAKQRLCVGPSRTPCACCHPHLCSHRARSGHTGGDIVVQPSGLAYGTSLEWRHSARSRTKAAVRFGLGTFSITLSTERALSLTSASAVGIALQLSNRGLMTKLRIQRHGHRLLLPIYLAASPSPYDLVTACSLPLSIGALSKYCVVRPLRARRSRKEKHADEKATKEASERAAQGRRSAAAEARLLEREAAARAREEMTNGGLVILAAAYGDIDAFLEYVEAVKSEAGDGGVHLRDDGWMVGAGGECWLDVRVPLQYAVADSTLRMPSGSKSSFRGFSPPPSAAAVAGAVCARGSASEVDSEPAVVDVTSPPPATPTTTTTALGGRSTRASRLWVRYRVGDEIRTANVADDEALQLGPA